MGLFEKKKIDICKQVKEHNKLLDCYTVGDDVGNYLMYKYINMEVALSSIRSGKIKIRFQHPSKWKDKYETLFYNADYSKITNDKLLTPKLYACCFTLKKVCEAAWSMYAKNSGIGKNCVQFKISRSKFRDELVKFANANGFKVYEGLVDYRKQYEIDNLYHKSSEYDNNMKIKHLKRLHEELFCGDFKIDNYLSLLLLKRDSFSYEKEYRFFLVPTRGDRLKFVDVEIPVESVISGIMVSECCKKSYLNVFSEHCKKESISNKIAIDNTYSLHNNKNITIEK